MRVVVQKCLKASCKVNNEIVSSIGNGLMLLVGFTEGDNSETIKYMVNKIVHLRIYEDQNDVMNLSILDTKGEILSISQFTLYGDASKGNRPSYSKALPGDKAKPLYLEFNQLLNNFVPTYPGKFGEHMEIELINNGPTTIILEK